jgi:hypothetical protein
MDRIILVRNTINDDFARAIGLVVAQWSQAEKVAGMLLSSLILNTYVDETESDEVFDSGAWLITVGMDMRVILGLTKTLFKYRRPNAGAEIDKLADRVDDMKRRRDLIAHSHWRRGGDPSELIAVSHTAVGAFKNRSEPFSVEKIMDIACEICTRMLSLKEALHRHGFGLKP